MKILGVLVLMVSVLLLVPAATSYASHSPDCGPPSTTIPGPPSEIISVGTPMPDEWLLCYIWHDIEGQDYAPRYFGEVLRAKFESYRLECWNGVVDGSGTDGIQAEVVATGDEGRQLVRFVYRIQLDGDYISNCAQELQ